MFFSHAFQSHSQAVRESSTEAHRLSAVRTACACPRHGCPPVIGSAWGRRALCQKQEPCMPEFRWHCQAHHVTCAPHLCGCGLQLQVRRCWPPHTRGPSQGLLHELWAVLCWCLGTRSGWCSGSRVVPGRGCCGLPWECLAPWAQSDCN